jgi:three-Cys-motif partner protein
MVSRDIHDRPFSKGTLTKLDIFEKYLENWLPIAIHLPYINNINICDFFAGTGKDKAGVSGSPLRISRVIKKFEESIVEKRLQIKVILNEYDETKYKKLCICIEEEKATLRNLNNYLSWNLFKDDFKDLFDKEKDLLKNDFNLMFLDQSGIKQVPKDIFLEIESFPRTDFMFFVSSSAFKRFADDESFRKYFPDIDSHVIRKTKQAKVHRHILKYYKDSLPEKSEMRLYPFTIKKSPNIYGIIFGTKHPRGVDKFLYIAWERNELNGEADFDIDEDLAANQLSLGFMPPKKTKIQKFEESLKEFILSKRKITNREVYDFTLESGHIPKHARKVIKEMKDEGNINLRGNANISYNKCYKEKVIKIFKVLKNEKKQD